MHEDWYRKFREELNRSQPSTAYFVSADKLGGDALASTVKNMYPHIYDGIVAVIGEKPYAVPPLGVLETPKIEELRVPPPRLVAEKPYAVPPLGVLETPKIEELRAPPPRLVAEKPFVVNVDKISEVLGLISDAQVLIHRYHFDEYSSGDNAYKELQDAYYFLEALERRGL